MGAYWISPVGDIMEVDSRHIHSIIGNPELFGLTLKKIRDVYRKHREPVGGEGNAREEIMIDLMNKGWIRVRYIPQRYLVTVQLSGDYYGNGSHATLVTKWAGWVLKKRDIPESVSVNVLDLQGEYVMPSGFQLYEISAGALHDRRKKGTFAAYLNPERGKRRKAKARWRPRHM